LEVAGKYVDAFGNLAKEGTTVVVPGDMGNLSGMIASALSIYGKVSESQSQATAVKLLGANRSASKSTSSTGASSAAPKP